MKSWRYRLGRVFGSGPDVKADLQSSLERLHENARFEDEKKRRQIQSEIRQWRKLGGPWKWAVFIQAERRKFEDERLMRCS